MQLSGAKHGVATCQCCSKFKGIYSTNFKGEIPEPFVVAIQYCKRVAGNVTSDRKNIGRGKLWPFKKCYERNNILANTHPCLIQMNLQLVVFGFQVVRAGDSIGPYDPNLKPDKDHSTGTKDGHYAFADSSPGVKGAHTELVTKRMGKFTLEIIDFPCARKLLAFL